MKIAFALVHRDTFRHLEKVIKFLLDDDNEIVIVTDFTSGADSHSTGRGIKAYLRKYQNCETQHWILRNDRWTRWIKLSRELLNYGIFFQSNHPSPALRFRWKKYISSNLWKIIGYSAVGKLFSFSVVRFFLKMLEKVTPPAKEITNWLQENNIDVVVAAPCITQAPPELEYLKAAKYLNIPCFIAIQSWDNLTTKGTLHVIPDRVFVWNQELVKEANEIHKVPAQYVDYTGSPTFDYWFDIKPGQTREEFCASVGLDAARPYLVYLCSSRGMIKGETQFIVELHKELKTNKKTRHVNLLVRPHPTNILDWGRLDNNEVIVFPRNGQYADIPEAKELYYMTLRYSSCVVGINTSAMVESAIVDKPCITILDENYKSAQSEMGHFRHLLNGQFMEVAASRSEAVVIIERIINGRDIKEEARKKFVHDFIRPQGIDRQASEVMVEKIKEIAAKPMAGTYR